MRLHRIITMASALLLGCGEMGYRVVLLPAKGLSLEGAVWELAILRGECTPDLEDGGSPAAPALVRLLTWEHGTVGPEIGDLDPGRYAFYARLRDAECAVRGAGCASVLARADGEGWIEVPVLEVEGPSCDDGDECTVEWCEGDECRSEVLDADEDGVPCPADCDDDDEGAGDVEDGCGGSVECEPLWVPQGDFELFFCTAPLSWSEALRGCESLAGGASLAVPRTWDEQDEALYAFDLVEGDWWIGANDRDVEGLWTDPYGNELWFEAWNKGSPDGGEGENCAALALDAIVYPGDWEDRDCEDRLPAVCVVP